MKIITKSNSNCIPFADVKIGSVFGGGYMKIREVCIDAVGSDYLKGKTMNAVNLETGDLTYFECHNSCKIVQAHLVIE